MGATQKAGDWVLLDNWVITNLYQASLIFDHTVVSSIKIFISPLSMLYLMKVLLMHLKKRVFYIMYKL